MRQRVWTILVFLVWAVAAHAVPIIQIPDPRPAGGWSVDSTGRIAAESLRQIDELAGRVKAASGGEIVVVAVGSTDGVPPRGFATDLFNAWRIGDKVKNDGVLLFVALDDRKIEIVLGDGLSPAVYNPVSAAILEEEILPRLRQGDPGGALVEGTRAVARRIHGLSDPPPVEPQADPVPLPLYASPAPPAVSDFVPAEPRSAPVPVGPTPSVAARLLPGVLALGLAGLALVGIARWQQRPPRCFRCGTETVLLGEVQDDAHLSPAEKAEERVGSVDHQVWACPACGDVRKESRGRFFSRYSACPTCGARTVSEVSTVVERATYDSGGLIRVEESCEHCGYRHNYERATPPEPRPVERRREREDDRYDERDTRSSYERTSSLWAASSSSVSSASSFSSSSSSSGDDGNRGGGSSSGDGGASGSW